TVLLHGFGFDPPADIPDAGIWHPPAHPPAQPPAPGGPAPPTVGIVFYRAHLIAGNTRFVDDLAAAVEARGARALAVWCYSLRPGPEGRVAALDLLGGHGVDAVITTVLAMGSTAGDDWDASPLAALGVPVVQAVAATTASATWEASAAGLAPVDVAMAVAIPEFDGRIISVPFSFKETVDDGDALGTPVVAYRTRPDRTARVAGLATRLARLRHVPPPHKRVAVVLSAYPTRRSRIGNAVGLDTPASTIALLHALAGAGYQVGGIPADGDLLMAALAASLGAPTHRWPDAAGYQAWFATLPDDLQHEVTTTWGPPPASFAFAGLTLGHVFVAIQPPRGFGENPVAVYHSPDLAPTHDYLA
ncbi:MAG: cobaltochelatase subunit CobN, partial [Acidimicrobiales bacterium]